MRKRFSRAHLLIEAYRMGVDDMVKELDRASRRMEEKCEKVRGALKRASAAFAKLEESPSGWSTPEAAPGTPTAAALTQQQPTSPWRQERPLADERVAELQPQRQLRRGLDDGIEPLEGLNDVACFF